MAALIYRCPFTGNDVQWWLADNDDDDDSTFQPVTCTACNRTHLVNTKIGKVLGAPDDD